MTYVTIYWYGLNEDRETERHFEELCDRQLKR
jgi:hypothetical protein